MARNGNFAFCRPYLPHLRQIGLKVSATVQYPADACARLAAQLRIGECEFSDGWYNRGALVRRYRSIYRCGAARRGATEISTVERFNESGEFRILCRRNYTVCVPSLSPRPPDRTPRVIMYIADRRFCPHNRSARSAGRIIAISPSRDRRKSQPFCNK